MIGAMGDRDSRPLTREAVIDAAIAVIDRGGVRACTMRGVSTALGVEPMSLYWHVANKDDLLDGVIVRILETIAVPPGDGMDWRAYVREFARGFRQILLDHPNVALLLAQRPVSGYLAAKRAALYFLESLAAAGFDEQQAADVARVVVRFVFSIASTESATRNEPPASTAAEHPAMHLLIASLDNEEAERLFDMSLRALIAGLDATVEHAAPTDRSEPARP